jgi:hypothetical protein
MDSPRYIYTNGDLAVNPQKTIVKVPLFVRFGLKQDIDNAGSGWLVGFVLVPASKAEGARLVAELRAAADAIEKVTQR